MMIKSRAPLRLGLAGGGTDVSPFTEQHGGQTVNVTIDKYVYCTIEELNSNSIEFYEADLGRRGTFEASERLSESDGEFRLQRAVYNAIVEFYAKKSLSFRMVTFSEAGPGSGLGGSSTFVVAMIKAYCEWLNLGLSKHEIGNLAYVIERIKVGFLGGRQDQYAAAYGGLNFTEYDRSDVTVTRLNITDDVRWNLESSMLLFTNGSSRESAKIIEEQVANTKNANAASIESLLCMKRDAGEMREALSSDGLGRVANIINRGWERKKAVASRISNKSIDAVMDDALRGGALAGRVSGAGGGGYMLFLVEIEKRKTFLEAIGRHGGKIDGVKFTYDGAQAWRSA